MSEKGSKEQKKDAEKILFGEKIEYCFACGTKIDPLTNKCPYCNTKQT